MKLLVVSQYFWPESFRINDLVREFVARGHEVTVLTGQPNYPDGEIFKAYSDAPEKFTDYFGAKIIRVPLISRGRGGFRLALNYASFAVSACLLGPFRLRRTEFDRILTFEPSPVTVALPANLLRKFRNKPMAFWVQDLWPETLDALGVVKSSAILNLVGRLVSFIYNRCDLILAQSQSFVPSIAARCRHPERIRYFPNW
ncbi:MAG TPA: glycosyltransferase family 4 protein, partial [Afipia sp.]